MPSQSTNAPETAPDRHRTGDLLACLRRRIRSGEYASGAWLPPERELVEEFAVPRRAVRRVIAQLADEGLLLCRPRFRPVVKGASEHAATSASDGAAERLVALVMWHGAPEETGATAQQRIFWGMNHRLARDGYHGVFLDLGDSVGTEEVNAEREAARLLYARNNGFAAIVFYAYAYRRNRELIQEIGQSLPLVLIDRMIPGIQADFVGVDNYTAMYEATQHLQSRGHRRVLFVTTAESINTVQDRLDGYRRAMSEAPDGPLPESVLTVPADWNAPEWPVFEALMRLPQDRRPTAVLCVNDHIAWNVHRRLSALGLRVPYDVALCGFDDTIPYLDDGVGLTTVSQPFEEIGKAAAEAVLSRLSPGNRAMSEITIQELPAPVVVRTSTSGTASRTSAEKTAAGPEVAIARITT